MEQIKCTQDYGLQWLYLSERPVGRRLRRCPKAY